MYSSDVVGHGPQRGGDDEEDQREGGQHDRQRDLVGRPLADGPFDQGDHAIEERLAGAGRDLHDDLVGKDPRAAGHAGAVAAGLADHGGRFAGDGRFVDRGHAFDDLAVAGNHFARGDLDKVARLERRGDGLLDRCRRPCGGGRGLPAGFSAGRRPGPCRGPRRSTRRSWRTSSVATSQKSRASR